MLRPTELSIIRRTAAKVGNRWSMPSLVILMERVRASINNKPAIVRVRRFDGTFRFTLTRMLRIREANEGWESARKLVGTERIAELSCLKVRAGWWTIGGGFGLR
ncbi:MAG: hypothetical protein ACTS7I_00845 [Candidatus Hodgkinia cicadicola]